MTDKELNMALKKLGLNLPTSEQHDLLMVSKFIEEIRVSVRKEANFLSTDSKIGI
jgi:hypothetical protein